MQRMLADKEERYNSKLQATEEELDRELRRREAAFNQKFLEQEEEYDRKLLTNERELERLKQQIEDKDVTIDRLHRELSGTSSPPPCPCDCPSAALKLQGKVSEDRVEYSKTDSFLAAVPPSLLLDPAIPTARGPRTFLLLAVAERLQQMLLMTWRLRGRGGAASPSQPCRASASLLGDCGSARLPCAAGD
eukprot:754186-Hanusia_phi.AAC.1